MKYDFLLEVEIPKTFNPCIQYYNIKHTFFSASGKNNSINSDNQFARFIVRGNFVSDAVSKIMML